jgi:hypothetical protein
VESRLSLTVQLSRCRWCWCAFSAWILKATSAALWLRTTSKEIPSPTLQCKINCRLSLTTCQLQSTINFDILFFQDRIRTSVYFIHEIYRSIVKEISNGWE